MVVWVRFTKQGPARYISHLDFARAVERAIRRAGLPVEFTKGFNPRMKISFVDAVPLGMESQAEWAQVHLSKQVTLRDFLSALNSCLPEGIRALEAAQAPEGVNSCPALRAITYRAIVDARHMPEQGVAHLVQQFLSQDTIPIKKGERQVDAKKVILRFDHEYDPEVRRLVVLLTIGGTSVRPEALLKALDELGGGWLDMETAYVEKLEVHW